MAISLNYCIPLHLSLQFCTGFNRQKQENDQIKFWMSVPSYVLDRFIDSRLVIESYTMTSLLHVKMFILFLFFYIQY